MSSPADTVSGHPVVEFTARLHGALDRLAAVPAWSMTVTEQRAALVDLARAQARVEELRLRVLASGDRNDLAADAAASSTGAWLAHRTRVPPSQAHRDVELAAVLDTDLSETRAALAAGAVNGDQARVIAATVQHLPQDAVVADPSLPGRAEKHLIVLAADHDARALKRLARHVLDVLDPAAADEALGAKLEAEERAAARTTSLEMHDNGDGTHSGRFKIPSLHAAMVKKALEAIVNATYLHSTTPTPATAPATGGHPSSHASHASHASGPGSQATGSPTGTGTGSTGGGSFDGTAPAGAPEHPDAVPTRPARPARPEQYGEAFTDLIERLDPTRLPHTGGVNATIVVTLDHDTLLTGLGTAHLDTGDPISAGLARRLACEAGIIPTVTRRLIDGRSAVLDMGRKRRLHTETQRIALGLHQGGCTTTGCTRPAAWCHAHHDTPWSHGGATSVTNGRLLCPHHHRRAHDNRYDTEHHPDGQITFHRRT